MAVWVLANCALGLVEVLQRDHGAGIGVDAKRHLVSPFWYVSVLLIGRFARKTIGKRRAATGFRFA